MLSRWSPSPALRRTVLPVAAVAAFVLVYAAGRVWLARLLDVLGAVTVFQLGRDLVAQIQNVGAFGLGVGAAGLALRLAGRTLDRMASRRTAGWDDIRVAAQALALEALRRSRSHPLRHKLNRPMPMRVWFTREGESDTRRHGSLDGIVELVRGLAPRQLVIVGAPGAGKSTFALLLTHRLLARPEAAEPMPLLVPISSWNPQAQTLSEFVVHRLEEEYGVARPLGRRLLTEPRQAGVSRDGFWLMPVLDGLDELPADLHAKAMVALEDFAAADQPFVLTSRVSEYRRAVGEAGRLSRAAMITLEEARIGDAIEFLTRPDGTASRWAPVLEPLRAEPEHALARVLSSPLMISLARDAYTGARTDPVELLAMPAQRQISSTLFAGYLTTAYETQPGREVKQAKGLRRYRPEDATRWLGTLAHHLYEAGTRDLRWWTMPPDLLAEGSRWARGWWVATVAVLGAVAAALPSLIGGRVLDAVYSGATAAALIALTLAGVFDSAFPDPYAVKGLATRRVYPAALWTAWGAACGLIAGAIAQAPMAGPIAGVITVMTSLLLPPPSPHPVVVRPEGTLLACHRYAALTALRYSLAAAVSYAAVGVVLGIPLSGPWIAAGVVVHGVAAALANGTGTWIRFRLTAFRLALQGFPRRGRGLLPLALVAFLRDGTHELRATLRQSGDAWQFRHALIQDHVYDGQFYERQRRLAQAGNVVAQARLADLLLGQADSVQLRRLADGGSVHAALCLSRLLREQGRPGEAVGLLRGWLAGADPDDAGRLVGELTQALREDGDLEAALDLLWAQAHEDDHDAANYLADLLCQLGRLDELRELAGMDEFGRAASHLLTILRVNGELGELADRIQAGDDWAAREFARFLFDTGDTGAEEAFLRGLVNSGHGWAFVPLADLLRERGDVEQAVALLYRALDDPGVFGSGLLAQLLRERGDLDELRRLALLGDLDALGELEKTLPADEFGQILRRLARYPSLTHHGTLLEMLRKRGEIDVLRELAQAQDMRAIDEFTKLLRERGHGLGEAIEALRRLPIRQNHVAERLAGLLADEGRLAEARALLERTGREGVWFDTMLYARILYELGDLGTLRRWADRGNNSAATVLARALRERGETEEAIALMRRSRMTAWGRSTMDLLTDLLREAGYADELRGIAKLGWWQACRAYAELLAERGELDRVDLDGYRHRAANGDPDAAVQLAFLLRETGHHDEAMAVLVRPLAREHVAREAFGFLAVAERAAAPAPRRRRSANEWADALTDQFVEQKMRVMSSG